MDRRVPGDEDGLAPDRDVGSSLLATALASLLPLTLLATWARLVPVGPWELGMVAALAAPDDAFGAFLRQVNAFGDLGVWAILVLVLGVGAILAGRAWAALLIGLTLVADFAGFLVKLTVERVRPEGALAEHLLGEDSFAFPSGHVVRATALAAVLAWLLAPARLKMPLAVLAGSAAGLGMGYARVALGVHWPSDVAGGVLLGIGWFAVTAWLVARRLGERPGPV